MRRTLELMVTMLAAALVCVGCFAVSPLTPAQAAVEEAAIRKDLTRDWPTLCKIASDRAKAAKPQLHARTVVCVIAGTRTTFKTDSHAVQTVSYECGVAPWYRRKTPPVATPAIVLDLLKEGGGVWAINGFP